MKNSKEQMTYGIPRKEPICKLSEFQKKREKGPEVLFKEIMMSWELRWQAEQWGDHMLASSLKHS